jgi:Icc-related predicted phosphoesterase
MKYLVLSDVHADFNFELFQQKLGFPALKDDWEDDEAEKAFQEWYDVYKIPSADGIIIAGDISNDYRSFKQFINFISKKYKEVILTLGNHDLVVKGGTCSKSNQEFINSEGKIKKMIEYCSKFNNVHFLEGNTYKDFAGCMGMCDFEADANPLYKHNLPLMWRNNWFDGCYWNYFNQQPAVIWDHYEKMMMDLVKKQPKVMITHFCPIELGISWEYRNNVMNPMFYFVGKKFLDEMADGSIWICGHIHTNATTVYTNAKGNKITIMARPNGYPGESPKDGYTWTSGTYLSQHYTWDDYFIEV